MSWSLISTSGSGAVGVTGDMPDGRQLESHWAEILTYSDNLVTGLRLYFNPLDFAPAVGRLGRMIGPAANRMARRGLAPVDD